MKVFLVITLSLLGSDLLGQNLHEYDRILVPIRVIREFGFVQGANGSQWATRFSLLNAGTTSLRIVGVGQKCHFDPCPPPPFSVPPGLTLYPNLVGDGGDYNGMILYVERGRLPDLAMMLRVQDISRQTQSWGTELPTVPEAEAYTGPINLLDVPTGSSFRSLLRIYDFQNSLAILDAPFNSVLIRVYGVSEQTNPALTADELLFQTSRVFRQGTFFSPGYAQLSLSDIPQINLAQRLRITIEPLASPGLRYWAFVSITNNETQHVTAITPR